MTSRRRRSMSATMTSSTTASIQVVLTAESTSLCLVSGAASMPADDRERWFRRYGSANALRQWRLDDRDGAIRQLAVHYDLTGGRALAGAIRTDLIRAGASGYRHSAPPVDDRHSL